ncbi:MAG: diguanylate cyclase domain-containing protein, partial [Burkholderiales bacterium]
ATAQLRHMAFYDTLTKLPNRRLLDDRLTHALAASKRGGYYGALMFLDLDNFKQLNDRFGHVMGDMLLVEVARRISGCLRSTDTVARFGGDEFVVMLSELSVDYAESVNQANIVAEKIRTALEESYILIHQAAGQSPVRIEHHCSSSIGVVLFPNRDDSIEEIMRFADKAMYQAKQEGGNRICLLEPGSA